MFVTGSSNTSILQFQPSQDLEGEDADRNIPWLEDTTLPGGLGDVMVRTGVMVHRIVVVVRRVHVVMEFGEGHVGG